MKRLIANGIGLVSEGENMPTDLRGVRTFLKTDIPCDPQIASNVGEVTVFGPEQIHYGSPEATRKSTDTFKIL